MPAPRPADSLPAPERTLELPAAQLMAREEPPVGPLIEETRFDALLNRAALFPVVLMAALALLLLAQLIYLMNASAQARHGAQVLALANQCKIQLLDQETGKRGFLITGEEPYLAPYTRAVVEAPQSLDALQKLVSDNPSQVQYVQKIRRLTGRFREISDQQIAARRTGGLDQARLIRGGKATMDEIRAQFLGFIRDEEALAEMRARQADTAARATLWFAVLGIAGVGALLALSSRRQLRSLAGVYSEATATVRTQNEVIRSREQWLATTLRSVGDGVLTTDAQGKVTFLNRMAERLTGWTHKDALGRDVEEVFRLKSGEGQTATPMQLVLRGGQTVSHTDAQMASRDGREIPVSATATPLVGDKPGAGANLTGAVLAFRDITERKAWENELVRARDAAESANRTKSLFLANMSHELRTPLNAVIGYSEMLLEEAQDDGPEHFAGDLRRINGAGKHLLSLINDILDLSKIEAGKMELYLETFDVRVMLRDVEATVQTLVAKKNNRLTLDVSEDVGSLHADLTKVRQLLFNLLSNAAKFTENGTIALSVRPEGKDTIVFAVTDTGIGMSPEQVSRLFEPFAQADASTTRKYGGTGLGLAITRHFARMMGGDVAVTSQIGHGSTFLVRLPAVVMDSRVREGESAPTPVAESVARPGPHAQTLLVIDDDPAARDLMRRYLGREGFHIEEAASGADGLRLARELRPSAITLDVMMPGIDGWSVLQALKADPITADIPVVMLSMVDDKNLGFALGAAEYLTKPVDKARLSQVLSRYRCDDPGPDGCRVLVVEDDDDTRHLLRELMHKEGWTVDTARNGREGLEQVQRTPPRLILLDLMMPEMDGFQFAASLRQTSELRQIPIIVMTAKDLTHEDRARLSGYVEKIVHKSSWSGDTLLDEVRALILSSGERRHDAEIAAGGR